MVGLGGGGRSADSAAWPEEWSETSAPARRLAARLSRSTALARAIRIGGVVVGVALSGWLVVAVAQVAVDRVAADGSAPPTLVLHEAYQARLTALIEERDQQAAEARSAQARFRSAMDQISQQQTTLLQAVEERRELETQLGLMRDRLARAVEQRDAEAASNDRLVARMDDARASLQAEASGADLAETLEAVTGALAEAVEARDLAAAERETVSAELAATELELRVTTRRQEDMIAELRTVVTTAFGPLEEVLRKAELDVDSVLASVRQEYSGIGGPLVPIGVSSRSYPGDAAVTSRFDELMIDIDRMNLLRIAVGKVPYAMPVADAHRFTSGFGYRRDPKGGGRRMHSGVDFAAPRGTPIYATADGVVVSARSEGGYGVTVRIQHDFGFETVYAHQSQLRVKAGQRVSRGEHIGDMGRTGRATGVHLHYEVHLNGRPMNPMTYVEAAKDVF